MLTGECWPKPGHGSGQSRQWPEPQSDLCDECLRIEAHQCRLFKLLAADVCAIKQCARLAVSRLNVAALPKLLSGEGYALTMSITAKLARREVRRAKGVTRTCLGVALADRQGQRGGCLVLAFLLGVEDLHVADIWCS